MRGATVLLLVLLVLLVLLALPGCPAHTDYGGRQRLTDHTAYTLPPGEGLVGLGLVGTQMDNLLASMRLEWSPFVPGLEIGTNLAHDALPMLNFYAKYTALDTRWVALGVRLGGRLYGLFESPWVIATELTLAVSGGHLRADIELAANRFTAILYDGDGESFRLLITHPEGRVTSARVEGANGLCWLEVAYDPATGAYGLGEALPDCDF